MNLREKFAIRQQEFTALVSSVSLWTLNSEPLENRLNYFAHALPHLADPWFVAGTAVPDWLGAVARRTRPRPEKLLPETITNAFPHAPARQQVQAILAGIEQHHRDDDWFHRTAAFQEVQAQLTLDFRQAFGAQDGFRGGFLAHLSLELLLDASLMERYPGKIDQYYESLKLVDAEVVELAVNLASKHPTTVFDWFIPAFLEERFLPDYLDDTLLSWRLRQVWKRIGLDHMPEQLEQAIPAARKLVRHRTDELLPKHLYAWPIR